MTIKQDININGLVFQCELDKSIEGGKRYVMLRSYDLENNVIYDRELYFIEKDLLSDDLYKYLIYPVTNEDFKSYSTEVIEFNNDIFDVTGKDIDRSPLVYDLVDKGNKEISIRTIRLNLYKPHVISAWNKIPFVLHVYSIINNIKVHLFVRTSDFFSNENVSDEIIKSDTERTINHLVYSEYLSIEIPDVDDLFSGGVYFENNLNRNDVVSVGEDEEFYNKFKDYVLTLEDGTTLTSLRLYNVPFYIKTLEEVKDTQLISLSDGIEQLPEYVKCYVPEYLHSNRLVDFEFPVTVLIYPYKSFNEEGFIQPSDRYTENSDVFFTDSRIKLSSRFGFGTDGSPVIINTFNYPNKERFSNFAEAYQYFNGVDLKDYENIIDDEDDWWDDNTESTPQLGVRFEAFSDKSCKNKIYTESYFFETDEHKKIREIDDFEFSLEGLFSDWEQLPGTLFVRCKFIDKYLGKITIGSLLLINKEEFKYLVNSNSQKYTTVSETQEYVHGHELDQDNIVSKQKGITKHDINYFFDREVNLSNINLLNNVTVNVIEKDSRQTDIKNNVYNNSNSSLSGNSPKVIYKPIFYRVQSLQSISLSPNIGQNIGINLLNYLTKVETFKLVIGDYTIVESARNNAYVIFNFRSDIVQYLANFSGQKTYYVTNQDDELISTGSWTFS